MWKCIAKICMAAAVILIVMIVVLEWMAGCGERIYHKDGTWRSGECIILPHEISTGRWR
jgi:hypothetical protein